jgi:predicted NBD/HSP70 family sugar kinase
MILGLDLSDGVARAVVINQQGQVLARGEQELDPAKPGPAAHQAARRAIAGAGAETTRVGIALPRPGDEMPPDLADGLAELLPRTAEPRAVSAGVAAVVAEQWCGAARDLRDVVGFSVGQHVTAGILLKGEPWLGAHGLAGSIGWFALNPVEREDYRRLGGLEAEIAESGIVRRIVWRIKSGDESVITAQVGGDLARVTAAHVFQGARSGDGVCVSVVRDTAKYIGMALSNIAATLDPEAIVLGGMIATSGDVLLESIRTECARRLRPAQADRLRIVLSRLGSDAAAIGAARLASAGT